MTKGHEETFRGDEYVHDFDYGDGFMVPMSKFIKLHTLIIYILVYVRYTSIKLFTKFLKIFIYIKSLKV